MSTEIEIIFLGVNDAGMRVYEWLCDREGVFVHALLTTESQLDIVEVIYNLFDLLCLLDCVEVWCIPRPLQSMDGRINESAL